MSGRVTPEVWLRAHPYLEPIARFCDAVARAVEAAPAPAPREPSWDDHAEEYSAGVPLLQSSGVRIDLEPAGATLQGLAAALAADAAAEPMAAGARELEAWLAGAPEPASAAVRFLLGDEDHAPPAPGLLRYLGWTALARHLSPVLAGFTRWRDEGRWLRRYCPACGALPAMAQLVGIDPGRRRLLACGRCRTRWWFARTACPFCEEDRQKLAVLALEGEGGLRIDWCEACSGYLKTYAGQGDEGWMLADWTSLHLDVGAAERGLVRSAASLFSLGGIGTP